MNIEIWISYNFRVSQNISLLWIFPTILTNKNILVHRLYKKESMRKIWPAKPSVRWWRGYRERSLDFWQSHIKGETKCKKWPDSWGRNICLSIGEVSQCHPLKWALITDTTESHISCSSHCPFVGQSINTYISFTDWPAEMMPICASWCSQPTLMVHCVPHTL